MTGHLTGRDITRMRRSGMVALTPAEGLALLDAALVAAEPAVVAAHLDPAALRDTAVPALLRGLLSGAGRAAPRAAAQYPRAAAARGPSAPPATRAGLLGLVRDHAAVVLGHGSAAAIPEAHGFLEIGFDSLTAVELRNRLATVTGLRLPATLIFDHPTPGRLAEHLAAALQPTSLEPAPLGPVAGETEPANRPVLESASADEVFAFIDQHLGRANGNGSDAR
ncbi:acyl carrier protein [Actinoplanes sp. LDG1-06]|uniref:Acyl carrier protein n=1 Tax=Paractinoplanes ovalisporus TaxID=2810368 RepID=A0ABS2AJI9_9ACTN|nr:acyl carrier protein [Actinoplanes ovalisporus]